MKYLTLFSLLFSTLSLTINAQVVINEVNVTNGMVEIKNIGASPHDITGYMLCNFPNYIEITQALVVSGDLNISSGGIILVSAPGLNWNLIDDEVGLYIPTFSFGVPANIRDYIEWGLTPHTRSPVAVSAGVWTVNNFIPSPPAGQTINFDGAGDTASDYYFDDPTLGSENNLPPSCTAANFSTVPTGLEVDQTISGGTKTQLKWDHYSDFSDGCIMKGATSDGVVNTGPFGQVLAQGILIAGDGNGQDKSAQLLPNATYNLFNPTTFPAGGTNSMIPGEQYMWQVRCGCIIDSSLPFPDRLFGSNVHLSPWSNFQFFTNLSIPQIVLDQGQLDMIDKQDLFIYPNPASNELTIDLRSFSDELSSIIVFDFLGNEVIVLEQDRFDDAQFQISISHLENGIYMIWATTEHEVYQKSFMKK